MIHHSSRIKKSKPLRTENRDGLQGTTWVCRYRSKSARPDKERGPALGMLKIWQGIQLKTVVSWTSGCYSGWTWSYEHLGTFSESEVCLTQFTVSNRSLSQSLLLLDQALKTQGWAPSLVSLDDSPSFTKGLTSTRQLREPGLSPICIPLMVNSLPGFTVWPELWIFEVTWLPVKSKGMIHLCL